MGFGNGCVMRWGWLSVWVLIGVCLGCVSRSVGGERPNVILIMSDDQGYGDFGATGNEVIATPSMDAFAEAAASVTQFYVSPVCSPTRACLMTGRYNYRTRVIDTWLGRSMMDPAETTLAELLGGAGYATGIFGKWHLGDCYPMRAQDQGFQETWVHAGGGLAQPSEPRENGLRYTDPLLFHNGELKQTEGFCTDVYFDKALEFIGDAAEREQPFFVYLPTNAPHGPYHDVPEGLLSEYLADREGIKSLIVGELSGERRAAEIDTVARIAAMITNLDENMGRLLRFLDDEGLAENTIVMFLTDNGPNTRRYVGSFRGKKTEVHEGGVRTVFWFRWPAKVKAGCELERVSAHIDVVPTVLDACGVQVPEGLELDGESFFAGLVGDDLEPRERPLVLQTHRGDQPQRYHHFMLRDGDWKLVHASGFGRESFSGEPAWELYRLDDDPREMNNLARSMPDKVAELKAAYDRWFDDVSSTRPDNYAAPRIHVGTAFENPTRLTRQDWRGGTWAPTAIGEWLLWGERGVTVELEVLIDPRDRDEELVVEVGELRYRQRVVAGSDRVRLAGVRLPAGEFSVVGWLVPAGGEGAKRGVYQVLVEYGVEADGE